MFKRIKTENKLYFPGPDEGGDLSEACKDFMIRLLDKNPERRLGHNGFLEVMQHPFFRTIDFQKLQAKEIPAPYLPPLSDD